MVHFSSPCPAQEPQTRPPLLEPPQLEPPQLEPWPLPTPDLGLLDNEIFAITPEPGTKAYWFGTYGGGATRYDLETKTYSTFEVNDGLPDNDVHAIAAEPGANAMWFGTLQGGAVRLDLDSHGFKIFDTSNGLPDNTILALAPEPGGEALWFGTFNGGAARYEFDTETFQTFDTRDGLPHNDVRVIIPDPEKNLVWLGTRGGGVARFDLHTSTFQTFDTQNGLPGNDIRALALEPPLNAIWLAIQRHGVVRFDPTDGTLEAFHRGTGFPQEVQSIVPDVKYKALWFGSLDAGVVRYDLNTRTFQTGVELDLPNVEILSLTSGQDALWLGTLDHGVMRFDLTSHALETFAVSTGFRSNQVRALRGEPNALRIRTGTRNFVRYDLSTGDLQNLEEEPRWSGRTHFTEPNGNVKWTGNFGHGLTRHDLQAGTSQTFDANLGLPDDFVYALAAAPGATYLWIATGGMFTPPHGATRFAHDVAADPCAAGSMVTLESLSAVRSHHLAISDTLLARTRPGRLLVHVPADAEVQPKTLDSHTEILDLAPGPTPYVWLGQRLAGLWLRAPGRPDHRLTLHEGLPDLDVTAIAPIPGTSSTQAWIATARGAAKVRAELERGTITGLAIDHTVLCHDGLPTGPVNALAAAADGSAYLAWDALPPELFLGATHLAQRRQRAHVRHISPEGKPRNTIYLAFGDFRALALAPAATPEHEVLWAATTFGLYYALNPRQPGAVFVPIKVWGLTSPLDTVKLAPDGTVWVITTEQLDTPPQVIGYRPTTGESLNLTTAHGIPPGPRIHDLDFTNDGELVVLVGSRLVRGRVEVPTSRSLPMRLVSAGLVALLGLLLIVGIRLRQAHR